MKPCIAYLMATAVALGALLMADRGAAVLVQPHNYLVDDSSMVEQPDGGSLAPYLGDQASEQALDRDIIGIIGERLARLRWARMLDAGAQEEPQLSPEMAELVSEEAAAAASEPSSESVASMLLKAAAAEQQAPTSGAATKDTEAQPQQQQAATQHKPAATPAKSSSQWFNPKEVIPVLKISSMATPSKYKKVYFRSEKKLIDGAFHSAEPESELQQQQQQRNRKNKKSLLKPFAGGSGGVQRRSSRGGGASSAAPPSPLQDGVIEFLRKFRDVYIQTRPVNTASGSSGLLASASAASPLASIFGGAGFTSGSSKPGNSLVSTLSAATSLVAQAAGAASAGSQPAASSPSGSSSASPSTGAASPLSAQSYVSFWSKTFPDWVRKTLKQLRRRSLHNSRRHQQQHQHHHHHSALGQAAQAAASAVVEHATSGSSSSSASSGSS